MRQKFQERSSYRLCSVAVGWDWYRGDRPGSKSRGHGGGRGWPRPWDSWRGVSTPGRWLRGPAGLKASPQQMVHCRLLLLYVGGCEWNCGSKAASPSEAPESQARQGWTRSGRWLRRSRSRVKNSLKKQSAGRRSLRQPGLLRSPCRSLWVRQKPKRKRCRLQAKPAPSRDSNRRWPWRQKHKQKNSPKEQKVRQLLYVVRVCENRKNRRR